MGFVDDKVILQIFEQKAPSAELQAMHTVEWIQSLNDIFEKNTIKIEFDQDKIFQNIKEIFTSDQAIDLERRD